MLKDKIAIVAGGGSGLGKALAKDLAASGAVVEICGMSADPLIDTCSEIIREQQENLCHYTLADVGVQANIVSFIKSVIERHKRVDIVINCAGYIFKNKILEEISEHEYERSFDTNMKSIFYFSKYVLPIMKQQNDGIIINITSTAGIFANSDYPIYSATKFAARGFSQAVGKSLKGTGILYFSVAPAGMNTQMRELLFGTDDASKQQKPEEVSKIIMDAITKKINVQNGGEIIIKNGKIDE